MSEEWPNLSAEDEDSIDQLCGGGAAAWTMKSWVNTLNRELQSARATLRDTEVKEPDGRPSI